MRIRTGQSLAKLTLERKMGKLTVRKDFCNDLPRADKAVALQKSFKAVLAGEISMKSVEVLGYYSTGRSSHLVMPYIVGLNGEDFGVLGTMSDCKTLATILSKYLKLNLALSNYAPVDWASIESKVMSVANHKNAARFCDDVENSVNIIKSVSAEFRTITIPYGYCHGDLTLSNLILTQDKIVYLFDFLPTFINTPLQDIAKLDQDLIHGWSFRRLSTPVLVKSMIFCKTLQQQLGVKLNRDLTTIKDLLGLITILRVIPYVEPLDDETSNWVKTALRSYASLLG
jgi:hypothetical protein